MEARKKSLVLRAACRLSCEVLSFALPVGNRIENNDKSIDHECIWQQGNCHETEYDMPYC